MVSLLKSPMAMLGIYCAVVFVASLAGGWLPILLRLTHTRLQVAVSFVGGLMLGLSLLGLLPHALQEAGSVHQTFGWLLGGFLVMFFLQRFVPFHHHDVAAGSPLEPCGHTHSLAERSARSLSWVGVALGLSLHSIFDGLALAATVKAGVQTDSGALGLGTALAIILHKPFGALAIGTLMVASRAPRSAQQLVNLAFALVTPLGALLFFLGADHLAHSHPAWLGDALAFCAGTFLCIACSDLLPELQFHSHDRVKLSVALLAGLVVAILIVMFGHARQEDRHDLHGRAHRRQLSSLVNSEWTAAWPTCAGGLSSSKTVFEWRIRDRIGDLRTERQNKSGDEPERFFSSVPGKVILSSTEHESALDSSS